MTTSLFMRGERIQYHNVRPIIGPPAKWRFTGGPMMAQHLKLALQLGDCSGIAKKPYFCDFSSVTSSYILLKIFLVYLIISSCKNKC